MKTKGRKPRTIAWFDEIDKDDIALVGGKGANLGEMTKAKIPVPPGFIVTAQSYFQFVKEADLATKIQAMLNGLDSNDSPKLRSVSANIKKAIMESTMPGGIAREIRAAYRKLGGPVAVRSSATAEDLPEASFAGQQSTFLNVTGEEEVVKAVQECWASLFETRAIFYREEQGFGHLDVGIAVPVQRMVQSEVSGVLFTLEPVTNDLSKVVIEAVFGLGEAIVAGEATPDLYVVDKESLEIKEKAIARQEWQLVRNIEAAGNIEKANIKVAVPEPSREAQKLSDSEIVALARLGKHIEEHYRFPQDIEWAKENGQLYILQARPVTTTKRPAEEARPAEAVGAAILLSGSQASPGVEVGPVRIIPDGSKIHWVRKGDVLVAEMTTPDFVPAMKRASAIITDRGGRTCHAAIVSRELGIPCVVGTGNATKVLKQGQIVTVDGSKGKVYDGRVALDSTVKPSFTRGASIKTRTRVYVNLAEPELADRVAARNVDGVGLLRAEFMVAQIGEHPNEMLRRNRGEEFTAKLARGLATFAGAFDPRPVVYRTTDFKTNEYRNLVGGDKYEEVEENPMLGYRGCSRYIRDLEAFRLETEAIKRVRQVYKNLWVMIPFVRTPQEMAQVKQILEAEGLARTPDFKLWMMVEVPSNIFLLDEFLGVGLDGISIGSNDLTQLILGIDRDNLKFADQFDERNPAVMMALEKAVKTSVARGVTCSICGQAPSFYPELTEKLVEWGITSVSVSPDAIERTREVVADVEARAGERKTSG